MVEENGDNETVEERVVERRPDKPPLALPLAFVVLGLALIAVAVFVASGVLSVILGLGGVALVGAFGYAALGAKRIGGSKHLPGAEIPRGETVRTTVRKKGFPKHGEMPAKQGKMPLRGAGRRRRGPGSGRGG